MPTRYPTSRSIFHICIERPTRRHSHSWYPNQFLDSDSMSSDETFTSAKISQEDFDTIQNRIQLALAKHENIVKSWTASSARKGPTKTQEQLDVEDAALFRDEPPYLGVGAPIPSHYLVSDAERNNKLLRAKFFPTKGLRGSKPGVSGEKGASAKRALKAESSDEEPGRSSLGKAKKVRTTMARPAPDAVAEHKFMHKANDNDIENVKRDNLSIEKPSNVNNVSSLPQLSLAYFHLSILTTLATSPNMPRNSTKTTAHLQSLNSL